MWGQKLYLARLQKCSQEHNTSAGEIQRHLKWHVLASSLEDHLLPDTALSFVGHGEHMTRDKWLSSISIRLAEKDRFRWKTGSMIEEGALGTGIRRAL